jgi:hypothetical protein
MRQGAMISISGASAAYADSKRTWSLPLPVQPCARAVQPVFFATLTCPGRGRAGDGGAEQVAALVHAAGDDRGHDEVVDELFLEVHDVALAAPESLAFFSTPVELVGALADVADDADDLRAGDVLLEPGDDAGGVEAAGVCEIAMRLPASWDDIEAWLAQGPGTLIIDWPSLGWRDVHVWWTRESVARTASEHGVFPPPLAVEHVQPGSVSDGPRPCDLAFTAWLIVRYFHRHRGLATLVACTHSARARSALERRISALCAAHPHLETIETRSYEEIIIANEAAAANRSAPAA